MPSNLEKVFEREDGCTEYTYKTAANHRGDHYHFYDIKEWGNTFTVVDWFRDNTFDSLEAAIEAIEKLYIDIVDGDGNFHKIRKHGQPA